MSERGYLQLYAVLCSFRFFFFLTSCAVILNMCECAADTIKIIMSLDPEAFHLKFDIPNSIYIGV